MCRVTVVDDEPTILEVLCLLLDDEGHEVTGIGHPNQVLNGEARPRPDLFLIDLMLPGMNGVDLAHRLRMQGFPDTPMIAISASRNLLGRAMTSGLFQDALRQPFELEELVRCVDRHLEGATSPPVTFSRPEDGSFMVTTE